MKLSDDPLVIRSRLRNQLAGVIGVLGIRCEPGLAFIYILSGTVIPSIEKDFDGVKITHIIIIPNEFD